MKCEVCKTNEARILITDVGNFCMPCHNNRIAELFGISKLDDFERMVTVTDADGKKHRFEISNMLMNWYSQWNAEEVGGGYRFDVMAMPEGDQERAVQALHQKIADGLGYMTLEPYDDRWSIGNAIRIGKKQYGLHSVGTFRIEHDDVAGVNLIIDGKTVPLKDFGRALTSFEGFNMDYQIRSQSDAVLGKAMALKAVSIDPEVILDNFERTLGWFLNRGFLSYTLGTACEDALVERIEELELLYHCGNREKAVEVATRMKDRLLSIDNDTEDFPERSLDLIDEVIQFSI